MNGIPARKSGSRTFRRRCSGSFLLVFVPERVDDRIVPAVPAFNLGFTGERTRLKPRVPVYTGRHVSTMADQR
jgi:hypothetical protein